jgi:hypothetical protein
MALLPADEVRASDAERDEVIERLRVHAGDGRLSVEELDERVARAYELRTRAELAGLLRDLPEAPAPAREARPARRASSDLAEHVRVYVLVNLLLVGIWLASGAGYFWPVWPILGWGFGVAIHAACRPRGRAA